MARMFTAVLLALAVAGCGGITASNRAKQAQTDLVGYSKERILACMGAPEAEKTVGQTEVWTYSETVILGSSTTVVTHSCTANVVFRDDAVASVSYKSRDALTAPYATCYQLVGNCVP